MNRKILVIDDDHDILDAIQFLLEDAGYEVEVAEKGERAEKLLRSSVSLPSLLILDALLSGKDGRVITQQLKADKRTCQLPIIMMSAHSNIENSIRNVGANEFIAKPFDADFFLSKVKQYVSPLS